MFVCQREKRNGFTVAIYVGRFFRSLKWFLSTYVLQHFFFTCTKPCGICSHWRKEAIRKDKYLIVKLFDEQISILKSSVKWWIDYKRLLYTIRIPLNTSNHWAWFFVNFFSLKLFFYRLERKEMKFWNWHFYWQILRGKIFIGGNFEKRRK